MLITRRWQNECGLPDDVQESIAAELERIARGLILGKRSDRDTRRLASTELQRLAVEAGINMPKKKLATLCALTDAWVSRFVEMKAARDFQSDHKHFSDKHEHRILRDLTERPMEVLMGDVHKVDMNIKDAIQSGIPNLVMSAKEAAKTGRLTIRVAIIGWMDGSSHYLWATIVILGAGQGVTQQDVAKSLYDVMTCPWGGIPSEFMIDNGSEYKALAEAVMRFCAMSEMSGLGVIKSRPYSPEGKGRIEGAFGILEKRFLSALPGYIGGDRMNSPTKSKGKLVDPYPHGPRRLISDIYQAVDQFNGTAQHGNLGGLSPKGMMNAKIEQTGWTAQKPSSELFDLVFSKSIERDIRQGGVEFDNRVYQGDVLAKLTGAKQVEFLVPMRDPEGPVICFHEGVIHWLHSEKFALNDRGGAKRKGTAVKLQKDEMKRRIATADSNVDVQRLLTESADAGPVVFNSPDEWTFGTIDKAGVLCGPMTEVEAEDAEDARNRKEIEDYLAVKRGNKREASGGNRIGPSSAT